MIHASSDITRDVKLSADVVVIGTGAGGAPVAKELAGEGYKVVVIEEGARFDREKDFNLNPTESFMRMYRDAGQTLTIGIPFVLLPLGKTLGGTTTVNSGTALRMLPPILKKWQVFHGLTEITADELNLLYAHLEEYLFVQRADPEVAGEVARTFLKGAQNLGLSSGWLPRNAKECEGHGTCVFGCASGAKQSMNVSFMPDADRLGADIYTGCRATKITMKNGRATGVKGFFLDPSTGKKTGKKMQVEARIVVLAAGAIYTPYFLQKQGIANSSGQVGRNLEIHPAMQVVSEMPERMNPPKGIPQSSYVDEFKNEGITLEGGTVPPAIHALALPAAGKKHAAMMSRYPNMGVFGGMISDMDSWGRVINAPRQGYSPTMLYMLRGGDVKKAQLSTCLMSEIWFAAGARKVFTGIAGHYEISNARELKALHDAKIKATDIYAMSAYHPLGTCRMGSDPESSVVKHTCETWDVENLYICDGSVLPVSPGVNPQLTIMALALRAAGFMDDRLSRK
ncbi:MAG: GMC family oxidoreductase [Candidatus Geothermincolia bacterium]